MLGIWHDSGELQHPGGGRVCGREVRTTIRLQQICAIYNRMLDLGVGYLMDYLSLRGKERST